MARRSNSTLIQTPTSERFRVWDLSTDAYDHAQLAENWDRVDAIIGRPGTGSWPTSYGVSGGIYGEIRKLQRDRMPLGSTIAWFHPFLSNATPAQISAVVAGLQAVGWALCDGSAVTIENHDWDDSVGTVYMPNLIHRTLIGASTTVAVGKAGIKTATLISSDVNAPGIVRPTVSGNGTAEVGVNLQSVNVAIPDHFHEFKHTHMVGDVDPTETLATTSGGIQVTFSGSSGLYASRSTHLHQLRRILSTYPRGSGHADMLGVNVPNGSSSLFDQFHTSVQKKKSGGTVSVPTGATGYGNAASHDLGSTVGTIDNRQASIPLIYIMKVKYSTDQT